MRPVLVREHLKAALRLARGWTEAPGALFDEALLRGYVQFLSKDEEREARVAVSIDQLRKVEAEEGGKEPFSHMELHVEASLLSTGPACTPHAGHNQGPRLVYAAGMAKQAMGAQHPLFARHQFDSQSNMLLYPQHMVETDTARIIRLRQEPITQTCVVAIMAWEGITQEDAIVIKKSALERGLGSSLQFRVIRAVEKRHSSNDREVFCNPTVPRADGTRVRGLGFGSYHAIDRRTGLPRVGACVQNGDVLIGKVISHTVHERDHTNQVRKRVEHTDCSVLFQGSTPVRIESVIVRRKEDCRNIIVRTIELHELMPGDKLSSLAAQKGILSGIVADEDAPFNQQGISPDIILAGYGFTSRMTIGQIITMLQSRLDAIEGRLTDATAFSGVNVRAVLAALRNLGVSGTGCDMLTCGKTGRHIGPVFMGLTSMMVLRHQVDSKVHARARGPVNAATRQPVEGKRAGGGLRIGHMELINLAGLGASALVKEMMLESDKYRFCICRTPNCHQIATAAAPDAFRGAFRVNLRDKPQCPRCKRSDGLAPVEMSFAAQLLKKELAAVAVDLQYVPEDEVPLTSLEEDEGAVQAALHTGDGPMWPRGDEEPPAVRGDGPADGSLERLRVTLERVRLAQEHRRPPARSRAVIRASAQ